MAGEWRELPFSQAVVVNPRVQLTRGRPYPFVDMGAVSPGSRSVSASEERNFDGGGSRFAVGDTLMARITPCLENGKIARFTGNSGVIAHGSTEFIVIRGREGVSDTEYAFYLTKWDGVSGYAINQMTGTSGRQRVPSEALDHLDVPVPPLAEQRAIAHILGTLDDKIELNRRTNETLEATARALFKSWFVDFDPIRAKAKGRDPGLPRSLADLFPNSFEDTELGQIPRGWTVGPILDHAQLMSGGTPKTDRPEYWNGRIPWASAKDVSQVNGSILVDTERSITPRGLDESATQMIPAFSSVVVARGATTGRMALIGHDMAMNQTCYALASTTKTPFALYCRLRVAIDALVHAAHGSVFDTITTSTFASSRIVLPARPALVAFEEIVAPLFHRALASISESRTLAALRDALLPKLVSGELRIEDPVQFLQGRD